MDLREYSAARPQSARRVRRRRPLARLSECRDVIRVYNSDSRRTPSAVSQFSGALPVNMRSALRGDNNWLYALVGGHRIGAWPRKTFSMVKPYAKINGEVSAVGDTISARLVPLRMLLNGRTLAKPTCAFTTQGVEPRSLGGDGWIEFSGVRHKAARVTYISLLNGSSGDTCPRISSAIKRRS